MEQYVATKVINSSNIIPMILRVMLMILLLLLMMIAITGTTQLLIYSDLFTTRICRSRSIILLVLLLLLIMLATAILTTTMRRKRRTSVPFPWRPYFSWPLQWSTKCNTNLRQGRRGPHPDQQHHHPPTQLLLRWRSPKVPCYPWWCWISTPWMVSDRKITLTRLLTIDQRIE